VSVLSLPESRLLATSIKGTDFATVGSYQDFALAFDVPRPGVFGFIGLDAVVGVPLYLDRIQLAQDSP
jgi:hypothetical protein